MTDVRIGPPAPWWLGRDAEARLERRTGTALRRARVSGSGVLASVTAPLPASVDPTAVVCASRVAGAPWLCLEQPQREGFALAALGSVWNLQARGGGRFSALDRRWRALGAGVVG